VEQGEVKGVMVRRITVTEVSDEWIEIRYRNNNNIGCEQRPVTPEKWPEQ
jgi:hypothetical protein